MPRANSSARRAAISSGLGRASATAAAEIAQAHDRAGRQQAREMAPSSRRPAGRSTCRCRSGSRSAGCAARRHCSSPHRPCRRSWRRRRSRRSTWLLLAGQVARHRHAEAGGDRGRAMRGAERVVLALAAPGEARQAAALAEGADAVAPAGQDLVRIGLVADIPDAAGRAACRTRSAAPRSVRRRRARRPRWPPVTDTAEIVSWRSSSASWRNGSAQPAQVGWNVNGVEQGQWAGHDCIILPREALGPPRDNEFRRLP